MHVLSDYHYYFDTAMYLIVFLCHFAIERELHSEPLKMWQFIFDYNFG